MPAEHNDIETWVARRLQFLGLISGTQGEDFRAEDFSGKNLRGKNFAGANLRLANFIRADLREADLSFATLHMADLTKADLRGAKLIGADLLDATLPKAKLEGADLTAARLSDADLSGANLKGTLLSRAELLNCNLQGATLAGTYLHSADARDANFGLTKILSSNLCWSKFQRANFRSATVHSSGLVGANLNDCNLSDADFSDSDLINCSLVGTDLSGCTLNGARVFGASVWNVRGEPREQTGLVVVPPGEAHVTVDDLELAQFIYLILNNKNVRKVINTITSKAVLILGRFTPERKKVLDQIRIQLNKNNYAPIIFDFENSENQSLLETIMTLAGMARFIIADVTSATMVREELRSIVEKYPSKPIQPILLDIEKEYITLPEMRKSFKNILATYSYKDEDEVVSSLTDRIITPAEEWLKSRKEAEPKSLKEIELEKEIRELKKRLNAI
jgi:uncharacterized protein YjbI with pentapeptide repeats